MFKNEHERLRAHKSYGTQLERHLIPAVNRQPSSTGGIRRAVVRNQMSMHVMCSFHTRAQTHARARERPRVREFAQEWK
jgi:hypothetical protein